jgi:hypothetical protein
MVMHRTKEFRPVPTQHDISWFVFHLLAALFHRIVGTGARSSKWETGGAGLDRPIARVRA